MLTIKNILYKFCVHQVSYIFFLAVTISAQFSCLAQFVPTDKYKRCPVNTINFENGLLNNSTTDIITDSLGFTWVSTKTGLQRYNGYALETVKPVVNKDTFNINYPVYFFGLKNGAIWISFKEGILEYNPYSNSFHRLISHHSVATYYSIIPLKETNDGIWCLQENKGIVLYNLKGVLSHEYFFDSKTINNILISKQFQYSNSVAANDKYIFINSTANKRILSFNLLNKTFGIINTENENIFSLACLYDHLYVLSDSDLLCLNINTTEKKESIKLNSFTKEKILNGCLRIGDYNQLLVSANNHLYELDSNCVYHSEITDLNRNPIVGTGTIFKIYADKFRRIWILTNNDIKRIQNTETAFIHFIYPAEKSNFVRAIYYDKQNKFLLAGCFNDGIQLYDTLANPLWKKSLQTKDVKDIIAIERLTDDEYLVITFQRGWYQLKLSTKQIKPFTLTGGAKTNIPATSANYCNNVQRINDSTLYIATATNIFKCIFHKNKLIYSDPLLQFDATGTVNCFLYSADKTLWTGTNTGLLYRFTSSGFLQTIHIPDNYAIRCITEDAQHNIWVGTDKGLYIFSVTGTLIKKVSRETGLLNDCIYSILPETGQTAVFASSNMGLSYITLDGTIKNFTREIGLQENEFNSESAIKTATGKFYFGGINGITAFYPFDLSEINDNPVLNITRLMVNDSLYNFSSDFWRNDSVILYYNQNHLEMDVAALGILNADEYEYQYRLKGFENNWQTTHHPTGIKYVLQPGIYSFEINCTPIFSSSIVFKKIITIIISPPWWQTWWFKIVVAVLGIGMIVLILQQYNRRKYQDKIRSMQMQQEIQQERERISRDLHDNLGAYAASIASNIDHIAIDQSDRESESALEELRSNSQSIVSQLGDTIWALKKEALSLTAISDRIKIFMNKIQSSYPGIKMSVSENITTDHVLPSFQAFHLLQIIQEAITNAVRHSKGSYIILNIEGNKNWKIIVKDDGKGMSGDNNNRNKGNGLINMKSRAEEAGWKIKWEKNDPGGTCVVIETYTTN